MKAIRVIVLLFLTVLVSQVLFSNTEEIVTAQGGASKLFLPLVNGGTGRVVLPDTTEVLSQTTLAQLEQVSANGAQFIFNQNAPDLANVQAGDIIVGEPTQETPDGFLRLVTQKAVSAGQIVLTTEQATLEEAITDGGMSISISLSPDDIQSSILAEGVRLEPASRSSDALSFTYNLDKVVFDADGDQVNTTNDQITAEGLLSLTQDIYFDFDIRNHNLRDLEFIIDSNTNTDLRFKASGNLGLHLYRYTIAHHVFAPITIPVPTPIGIPFPVSFTPELSVAFGLDGSIHTDVTFGVQYTTHMEAGLRYANSNWDLVGSAGQEFRPLPVTATREVNFRGHIGPEIALKLYGVVGPTASTSIFGLLELPPSNAGPWRLSAGLDVAVGVKVEVFTILFANVRFTVLEIKKVIAEGVWEPNQPPNMPSNPVPPVGATGQSSSMQLAWTGGDPDGDVTTYDVYLEALDTSPDTLVCNTAQSALCNVSNLIAGTTYYWLVVAKDDNGSQTQGPLWHFTTGSGNGAPYAPANPSPPHQSINQNINTSLTWVGGDPDGDPVTYAVYLEADDTSPDTLVCPAVTATTCTPSALIGNKTYYWQVIARDNQGHTTTGPVWQFTTRTAPEAPLTVDVVLIIDSSGSMVNNDPAGLRKEAAKVFVDTMVNNDMVSIVDFDGGTRVAYPLQAVTDDRSAIKAAINTINSSGSTNIGAGLQTGYTQLLSSPNSNPKAAVLLTDGQGNYNNQADLYKDKGWPVFTIGLSSSADEQLLRRIANETGGQYFALLDPNQLIQVYFAIQSAISGSDVVVTTDLTMSQGQTETVPATLSANQNTANFVVTWPGSRVDTTLIDPSGRVITPDTALSDPYVYHAKGPTYEVYRISYPAAGEWDVQLYGAQLAAGGETVSLQVSQRDNDLSGDWQPVGANSASGGGISDNSGASQNVTLAAAPGGVLYVAWSDTSAGDAEIYLRRWDGAAWSELGGSASGGGISNNSGDSVWPSLAVGPDGNPWVAWQDETPGAAEIYVRRWTGAAWEPVGSGSASGGGISNNSGDSQFVDLQVAANGQAFAVWTDGSIGNGEVYLRQWNGSAWVALADSASGGGISNTPHRSGRPAMALDAGLPTVAWAEGGTVEEIYLRRYNGSAWVELGNHSASGSGISNTPGHSQYATIAYATTGKPTVGWYDTYAGQREIYAVTLEGSQWVPAGSGAASGGGVSNTPGESREPDMAASDTPYLVWQEVTATDNEIYARRLSGTSWVPVGSGSATGGGISNNPGDSNFPSVAFGAGRLYVAWEDNSSGNYEVYILMNATP